MGDFFVSVEGRTLLLAKSGNFQLDQCVNGVAPDPVFEQVRRGGERTYRVRFHVIEGPLFEGQPDRLVTPHRSAVVQGVRIEPWCESTNAYYVTEATKIAARE